MSAQVHVFAGTRKGAFVFVADPERQSWRVEGPHFPGWGVQHMLYDPRAGRLFAALDNVVYGPNLHYSDDLGQTWTMAEGPFLDEQKTPTRLWHVGLGHPSQPGTVWLGGDPGLLFRSDDGGHSWTEVAGINQHPTRAQWNPGAGGLIAHTIVQDPGEARRLYVAISAAGVFRTEDGGETWTPRNQGVLADFLPEKFPEVGQCCHHLVLNPSRPDQLFQQNHCGVYRSDDRGDTWQDIGAGLPATFGFPIAISHDRPETIFVIPQISPEYRYTPEGRLRVYRSDDGGGNWQALTNGLPQENAYQSIYREAMAADKARPGGVYFGTTTGQLYGSPDEGDAWRLLSGDLPPVYSVETALIDR